MADSSGELLMIFINNPRRGKVKSRLAREVGVEQALKVYQRMLEVLREAALAGGWPRWLWYKASIEENDGWDTSEFEKKSQGEGDLGKRMEHAFREAFKHGFKKVVIIGAECPELNAEILQEAFSALNKKEAVIGPSTDGGFYLLGLTEFKDIFEEIRWSTESVYSQMMAELRKKNISFAELRELSVLNTKEDLQKFNIL